MELDSDFIPANQTKYEIGLQLLTDFNFLTDFNSFKNILQTKCHLILLNELLGHGFSRRQATGVQVH